MAALAFAISPIESERDMPVPVPANREPEHPTAARTRKPSKLQQLVRARLDTALPPARKRKMRVGWVNPMLEDRPVRVLDTLERNRAIVDQLRAKRGIGPSPEPMEDERPIVWDRSTTLSIGRVACVKCHGYGLWRGEKGMGKESPCSCTLREIFRKCFGKWRYIVTHRRVPHVGWDHLDCNGSSRRTYGRKQEEFVADFELIARRTLTPEEWRLFDMRKLKGADWRYCTQELKMDRGNFFHAVYRIEEKLGRAFAETRPYALWPFADYFS